MSNLRKFIAAAVGAILMGLSTFAGIGDGSTLFGVDANQIVSVVIALMTAAGVYAVPNEET